MGVNNEAGAVMQIKIEGVDYQCNPIGSGVNGTIYQLNAIGKRGQPLKAAHLGLERADGTIFIARRNWL